MTDYEKVKAILEKKQRFIFSKDLRFIRRMRIKYNMPERCRATTLLLHLQSLCHEQKKESWKEES